MMKTMFKPLFAAFVVMGASTLAHADVTIYAAASMTNAIDEINKLYEAQYKTKVKTSYASSGTLAKQIANGAPADVFISADLAWMDHLKFKKKIVDGTDRPMLLNRLVLIAPKNKPLKTTVKMTSSFNIDKAFTGKLCTGNVSSVPVGRYAKQALTDLNWWSAIEPRLVQTEDVRAALNFVNRGECQLGIVYSTDAKVASNVTVVGTFPMQTHKPIIYPVAMIKQNPEAKQYYQFLQSDKAKAVYRKYGFSVI